MPKEQDMKEIAPGIFKANEKTFYIKCCMSQKLCFCSKERLDKLAIKFKGMDHVSENYISRDAKRLKKAGTANAALKKMDPKDLSEEAKMIHSDKKKKREERKAKRENEERIEKSKMLHIDTFLPVYDEKTLGELTSLKGCLRSIYRSQWGCCNLCMYENGCHAEGKINKFLLSPKDVPIVRKVLNKLSERSCN